MIIKKYFSKYKASFKENLFFQNIVVVAGGNATAKLIGILATPIITRLYTPGDYGVFSVFMSVVGIAGSLATLRYAVTIPIARYEKLADNLLKLCFLITGTLSLIWFLSILFFGNKIVEIFSAQQLQPYLWLMPIVFLGQGVYEALNNWAVRNKNFKLITRTKISQSISSSGIKIGFGVMKITPLGLFIGYIAQEAAGITSLFSKLVKVRPGFFSEFSWKQIYYAAQRFRKFPLVQSWSQLLLALGSQLPVLLIGAFYGVEVVGVFGLAQNMINMPMDLIGQSVAQVYYAEISKYGRNNLDKIYKLSVSIIKKLFWVGLIPVGALITFGPFIFKIIFGTEWIDAGIYARILSIMILFRFISSPVLNSLNVLEKQGIQFWLNILRVFLTFSIFLISNNFGLKPVNALIIYSSGISIFYLFVILKILRLLKS